MNKKMKWDIHKWSLEQLVSKVVEKKIILPKFQRNLVWNKEQKEELFNSIKKEYPIGMLLFFKNDNSDSQLSILDGLQRITTIYSLFRNVFSCIKIEEIKEICEKYFFNYSDESTKESCKIFSEIMEEKNLKKNWIDWFASFLKNEFLENYHLLEEDIAIQNNYREIDILFDKLKKYCYEENTNKKISSKKNEIKVKYENFFSTHKEFIQYKLRDILELYKEIKTNKYNVPCMEFEGDNEEIMEIFTKLNEQGSKLKKIDIYKSIWEKNYIKILDVNIHKTSNEFFENINRNFGIELEDSKSINSYEIIYYALKKSLLDLKGDNNWIKLTFLKKNNEKFVLNHLEILLNILKTYFSKKLDSSEVDWKESDIDLGKIVEENIKIMEDIEKMVKSITKSFDFSNRIFNELNYIKGNKKNDNINIDLFPSSSHSVAIICNTLWLILNNNSETFDFNEFKKNYYKKYMSRFIHDLISETFNTSSSKNAFKSVKENHYIDGIDSKELIKDLESYFQKEKNKKNISKNSILIANLAQQDFISASKMAKNDFHYDHLVPKKISKNFKGYNSIANLSLLTESENLEKKDYFESNLIEKYDYLFKIENIGEEYDKLKNTLLEAFIIFWEKNNQENFDKYLNIRENMLIFIIKKNIL